MPLTEKGYERPNYDDILEAQIDRAKLLFGDDIDTNENTPLGKYIRLNVTDLADVYEILEKIYYSRFPNTAQGVSLDRLCPFVGITRNQATYAKHEVKFTGEAGEYVPEAFEVSAGDILFHTYDSVQIGGDGTATAIVECEEAGTVGNVTVGSIDTIVNPDTNVESVEHISISEYAVDIESDTELRYRFNRALSNAGAGTTNAIAAAITSVPLVDGVEIIENNTDEEINGLPAHSFACYVNAPDSQNTLIAEAIFRKKPTGIKSIGDVSINIVDDFGLNHSVTFYKTRQIAVKIYMYIITTNSFEANGLDKIKDNVVEYVNKLKNGEDVYYQMIYACTVSGAIPMTSVINGSTNNLNIGSNEVARTKKDYVLVGIYDENRNFISGDTVDDYRNLLSED